MRGGTAKQRLLDWLRFQVTGKVIAYHHIEAFATGQRALGFFRNWNTWDRTWRKLLEDKSYAKYGINIEKVNNRENYDEWKID